MSCRPGDTDDGFTLEEIYDAMQNGADDECPECGGDGYILDDCFEDTCCCLDPDHDHGTVPCPTCKQPDPRTGPAQPPDGGGASNK